MSKWNEDMNKLHGFMEKLDFVPGFRSGKLWKAIVAMFYYIFCFVSIIKEGLFFGLVAFSIPFVVFYGIDFIRNRKSEDYDKQSSKILLAAIAVMVIGSLWTPATDDNDVAQVDADIAKEDVQDQEDKKEEPEIDKPETENKKSEAVAYKGEKDLKVHFIDVGQGDSIFIELPNGQNVLIDGGPGVNTHHLIKYLKSLEFHVIDHLVTTHPHEDHIGGIPEVTRNWKLGKVYLPGKAHTTKIFEEMLNTFKEKGYSATKTAAGTVLVDEPGLSLKAIAPSEHMSGDNLNDYSIVLKLDYNNNSFLFTGDAEAKTETMLSGQDISVDVLKVGHHGSNTSSTQSFIKEVSPKHSVITCGIDNQYGHPDDIIVDRLNNVGSQIYRTDTDGTIVVTSDGEKIEFEKKGNPIQPNAPPSNKASGGSGGGGSKQEVTGQAQGQEVYKTRTGTKYHSKPCGGGTYSPISKEEAEKAGLSPCGRCY